MKYERLGERLLEHLNEWCTATQPVPGRIELTVASPDGSTRVVEIIMTRDEWDQMVTIPWGDFTSAAQALRTSVLELPNDVAFLVYQDYELVPSATPDLPADPADVLLDELARKHPEGFGRWEPLDRDGNPQP